MKKSPVWIYCLDLEGVLVPEIWVGVARRFRMKSLELTTRDIPDYDKLMHYRMGILRKAGIRLKDIQKVIAGIRPLPGARKFLDALRERGPVVILSDTFYQFAGPLMAQLGQPALFCNTLHADKKGFISGYTLRQKDGKKKAVRAFKSAGFHVAASGDSYNDLTMIRTAHTGVLFNPPAAIRKSCKGIPAVKTYSELLRRLTA